MSAKHVILIVLIALLSPFVPINTKLIVEKYVALFNPSREEVRQFFLHNLAKAH